MKKLLITTLFLAPAIAGAAACPNLYLGSRGGDVTAVQNILYSAYQGFPSPTGYFGPVTQAALKQWQSEHGIEQTGTVGPKTRAAMKLSCGSTTSTSGSSTKTDVQALIKSLLAQVAVLQAKLAAILAASTTTISITATTTTPIIVNPDGTTCTPLSPQTQTLSCQSGQAGSITQTRTSSCTSGAVTPMWSEWITTANTCQTQTQASWLNRKLGLSATQLPFSFNYGGVPASQILSSWTISESQSSLDSARIRHTTVYSDQQSGLQVRVIAIEYTNTGAVEWTLWFRNTGSAKTSVIDSVLPADLSLSTAQPSSVMTQLRYSDGSTATANDFQLHTVSAGSPVTLQTASGRSSDPTLPFFNLYGTSGGLVLGVGWSGDWKATFNPIGNDPARFVAGMKQTHFYLNAGEEVRSPSILVLPWSGGDSQAGQNTLRRFLVSDIAPKGPSVLLPISVSQWLDFNDITSQNLADSLTNLGAHPMPIDAYWVDAGWFLGPWPTVGTWRSRLSDGMQMLASKVRSANLGFILWHEPERVTAGTDIANTHPEWLLSQSLQQDDWVGQTGRSYLYDFGNPAALAWAEQFYGGQISSLNLSTFRLDMNLQPAPYWHHADASDRIGVQEMKYIAGLYSFLDYIRTTYPNVLIDNSASGGRRIDLEMLKRTVPLLHSDYTGGDSEGQQMMTYGISDWIPLTGNQVVPEVSTLYNTRSRIGAALNIVGTLKTYDTAAWTAMRNIAQMMQILRPLFLGDYYPLTQGTRDEPRLAFEFYRPNTGDGFVQIFARGTAGPLSPPLRGLDPSAQYRVIDFDFPSQVATMSGAQLMSSGPNGSSLPMSQTQKAVILVFEKSGTTGPIEQVQAKFSKPGPYSFKTDFSFTQGVKQWSYEEYKGAGVSVPLTVAPSGTYWLGDENGSPIITAVSAHPGPTADAELTWTAPIDGSIRIAGSFVDLDGACGDGVALSVVHNATVLSTQTIENNDTTGKTFDLMDAVTAGDKIHFILDKRTDYTCDTTAWTPTVTYQ